MTLRAYVSAHLDDAVFSCGGLMAQQAAAGDEVRVVTVCAGDPPVGELTPFAYELHRRWGGAGSPMGLRRAEDHVACGRLGASVVHLAIPDAIYRRAKDGQALYPNVEALFDRLLPEDGARIDEAAAALSRALPAEADLYAPLAIGGHVDHILTRRAILRLRRPLWFYRDIPYAIRPTPVETEPAPTRAAEALAGLAPGEIETWAVAAGEYHSQVSSFWPDFETMEAELRSFHDRFGGIPLLRVDPA